MFFPASCFATSANSLKPNIVLADTSRLSTSLSVGLLFEASMAVLLFEG